MTDAGHYSPDGNSDRISCTVPDDAKADPTSTGLSSDANQCWTCNAGFDDHDDDGTCSVTDAGHYSPDGNSDRISCTVPDDAKADPTSTGLSSDANQCWTCNAGYVRVGNICVRKITAITAGHSHTCALLEDKSVQCWGSGSQATAPSLNNASAITAGDDHTCALLEDKSVQCWGRGSQAPSLNNASAITAGDDHTCALLEDKSVQCWGDNDEGQATAPSLNNATAITAGYSHTCALLEDKSVQCWGKHYDDGSYSYVNHIAPSLNNATAITAGHSHTCALLEDKSVQCWGRDRVAKHPA